jgi:hypothetical protein
MDEKKVRACWLMMFTSLPSLTLFDESQRHSTNRKGQFMSINSSVQDFLVQYNLNSSDIIFPTLNKEIQ